ncbi:MAG: ABC transporter permease [Infirmifilum sp.]
MSSGGGFAGALKSVFKDLLTYKSGLIGIILLFLLIVLSIYTVITIPMDKAIAMWRGQEQMWIENPRVVPPEWIQIFVGKNLPKTMKFDSREIGLNVAKSSAPIYGTNMKKIHIEFTFDFNYDDFPSELNIFFSSNFSRQEGAPIISITWVKPDGEQINLGEYYMSDNKYNLYFVSDSITRAFVSYVRQKYGVDPSDLITNMQYLFGKFTKESLQTGKMDVEKGTYKVIIDATVFGQNTDLNCRMIVYGDVYGIAGTDHLRRPLEIALMWGAPIALAFGLTASLITTFTEMIIAAISGFYGGILDNIIQRITEVYMVLPFLPFLVLISVFYGLNIWTLLAIVIVLSIFGPGIKSTRALVMQIKEYPYIEAARTYGASDLRIIVLYIIPKILPPVVPGLISAVPGYVFLEAALAILGLGDPSLPTWGKVINDAFEQGALYKGYYYWVLEPSAFLMFTGLAFALLGFALDRIVNPRLREM